MKDNDFVWIAAGGTGGIDYDDIVVINAQYPNVKKVKQDFETEHRGKQFFYSKNFPKS